MKKTEHEEWIEGEMRDKGELDYLQAQMRFWFYWVVFFLFLFFLKACYVFYRLFINWDGQYGT